jgi:hypothetical protein
MIVEMSVFRSSAGMLMALALLTPSVPAQHASGPQVTALTPPLARRPAEVSVAINPTNTDHVIAVLMQAGGPGEPRMGNHAYTSFDGGRTWTGAPAQNADGRVQGDDAVAFGADGTAFHSYISFDGIRVDRPERAWSGIFVRTTKDGTQWTAPVPVVDHVNTAIPFEDKPWVGVDRSSDSPHRGNVYVAWTRFDVYGSSNPAHRSHIMFARSRDGGRTFSPPLEISDDTGDARDSDDTVEGVVPVAGLRGEVYVTWAGPKGIVFDKSVDGGWAFGKDILVSAMPGGWDSPVPGNDRHNGMPVTGVDNSHGPHRGTIYVNWIDQRHGDLDVFVAASKDAGRSWGAPVRVNDDAKGADQMFTWMAVDPADGSVNVIFHDRRGQTGTSTGVTFARSIDGGRTFVNWPLRLQPFDCCSASAFFGDYNAIDAHGGRVVAAFPVLGAAASKTGGQAILAMVARFKPGTQEFQ